MIKIAWHCTGKAKKSLCFWESTVLGSKTILKHAYIYKDMIQTHFFSWKRTVEMKE